MILFISVLQRSCSIQRSPLLYCVWWSSGVVCTRCWVVHFLVQSCVLRSPLRWSERHSCKETPSWRAQLHSWLESRRPGDTTKTMLVKFGRSVKLVGRSLTQTPAATASCRPSRQTRPGGTSTAGERHWRGAREEEHSKRSAEEELTVESVEKCGQLQPPEYACGGDGCRHGKEGRRNSGGVLAGSGQEDARDRRRGDESADGAQGHCRRSHDRRRSAEKCGTHVRMGSLGRDHRTATRRRPGAEGRSQSTTCPKCRVSARTKGARSRSELLRSPAAGMWSTKGVPRTLTSERGWWSSSSRKPVWIRSSRRRCSPVLTNRGRSKELPRLLPNTHSRADVRETTPPAGDDALLAQQEGDVRHPIGIRGLLERAATEHGSRRDDEKQRPYDVSWQERRRGGSWAQRRFAGRGQNGALDEVHRREAGGDWQGLLLNKMSWNHGAIPWEGHASQRGARSESHEHRRRNDPAGGRQDRQQGGPSHGATALNLEASARMWLYSTCACRAAAATDRRRSTWQISRSTCPRRGSTRCWDWCFETMVGLPTRSPKLEVDVRWCLQRSSFSEGITGFAVLVLGLIAVGHDVKCCAVRDGSTLQVNHWVRGGGDHESKKPNKQSKITEKQQKRENQTPVTCQVKTKEESLEDMCSRANEDVVQQVLQD